MARSKACAHCGNPTRGVAGYIENGVDYALCHPDDGMDCYFLVTVMGHERNADCRTCQSDPEERCPQSPW